MAYKIKRISQMFLKAIVYLWYKVVESLSGGTSLYKPTNDNIL